MFTIVFPYHTMYRPIFYVNETQSLNILIIYLLVGFLQEQFDLFYRNKRVNC
jgi:hypothetical protein